MTWQMPGRVVYFSLLKYFLCHSFVIQCKNVLAASKVETLVGAKFKTFSSIYSAL